MVVVLGDKRQRKVGLLYTSKSLLQQLGACPRPRTLEVETLVHEGGQQHT
jgi:hypothetical protein